jgi:hypothetical protein
MKLLILAALAASGYAQLTDVPLRDPSQVFTLRPGDYKWLPVMVRHPPTAIDCRFEVVSGGPTVHVELLSVQDFIRFARGHDYESLALTKPSGNGGFRRMIETPGQYRILIENDKNAIPAAVSLTIRTEVDPSPATVSVGLSLRRKVGIIFTGLTLFFATVFWSGRRLLRAYRKR